MRKEKAQSIQTEFQKAVYSIVAAIPRGQTLTYKQVAEKIGKPKACRAVGSALNKNTDANVPCHRVIKSSGAVGGYNRGLNKKRQKLRDEGAL